LEELDWLPEVKGRTFYPVGGAWRTLARIHMDQIGYPLHVIHHYSIARREAEDVVRILGRLSRRSLSSIPGLSKRRLETLPFAALTLERVLRLAKPERVVFSAFGLREGHLFAALPAAERAKDPLIAACAEFAEAEARFGDLGRLLQDWIDPLFASEDAEARRLRLAACTLSDIGWRDHPDYRAEQAFTRILRLPIAGIDHKGRVAIALAVFVRYGGEADLTSMHSVLAMLSEEEHEHWHSVGLALRLAYALSAATPAVLKQSSVVATDARLTLRLQKGHDALLGEAVERRLQALASAVGKSPSVTVGRPKRAAS
jgi:exopolyphosphatase/guanosine-5'-triphosphate,3'-diphosphate pyrophosphatase